jgi:hypothetical protein
VQPAKELLQPRAAESFQKVLPLTLSQRQMFGDPGERDVGLHAASEGTASSDRGVPRAQLDVMVREQGR